MIALVAGAVALIEVAFSRAAIPPGVDPGDWITRSYGYVGLAVPPADSFGSPFLYPPLIFPILGAIVLVTGSPTATGFVAGGLFFFLYGLSLIPLAVRFFRFGPVQVAFVGAGAFCGTTLSMLFWGAYPNLFAFVFFNLCFVFLLEFLETRASRAGFLTMASLALVYLSHSLTFTMAAGAIAVVGLLVLIQEGPRALVRRVLNRGFLAGGVVLVGTIAAYAAALRVFGIVPPNYLGANPAAVVLDTIGVMFAPLGAAPAFFPAGPSVYLSRTVAIASLAGPAVLLLLAVFAVGRWRPRWVDARHRIAVGVLASALLIPVGGTIASIGTDYPRFLYFLPVPALLTFSLVIDGAVTGGRSAPARTEPATPADAVRRRRARWRPLATGYLATGFLLTLLIVNVSIPTVNHQQLADTAGNAHTSDFLNAATWLANNPTPGQVLTLQTSARWIEAITHRGAVTIGPTWLEFEPWQIQLSQESVWALSSRTAATDGQSVLSYSSPSSPILAQTPMYSVYIEGVTFPIVRLLQGGITITATAQNVTGTYPGATWGPGTLSIDPVTGEGTVSYATALFDVEIVGALEGGGTSAVNVTVTPINGTVLNGVTLAVGAPPPGDHLLHAGTVVGVTTGSNGFVWSTSGTFGLLPDPKITVTTGTFLPAPASMNVSDFPVNDTLFAAFPLGARATAWSESLTLATPGTGNPGITLPRVMDTSAFLAAHDIHFLMVTTQGVYAPNAAFYEAVFGYQVVYANSGWEILEG